MTDSTLPLNLGVIAGSSKPDERRAPLHPSHLERIPEQVRGRLLIEHGYGEPFGVSDAELAAMVGSVVSRAELITASDVVLLPKPQPSDVEALRDGQVLWGWPHCVQDRHITQLAIDKRLTLIAFEAMNYWTSDGGFGLHVFTKNNELAGYCSVLHAMSCSGFTGAYGPERSAAVIGFGATARGAVTALHALGVGSVRVLTHRRVAAVGSIHSVRFVQLDRSTTPPFAGQVITDRGKIPLAPYLAEADIVVNCTLQNPNAPQIFLDTEDLALFRPGSLIVDVSCDPGMGFSWARTTTFEQPMFPVGPGVDYYAVDHSPSYLWKSATWEISEALLPFLPVVLAGPTAWADNETISAAVEIHDGVIANPAILAFQQRQPDYPHLPLPATP